MTEFAVGAPGHESVDVHLDGRRAAMRQDAAGGWWRVQVADAGAGTRYAFSVDGGPPRPDPRSPWQPEGVDAPSATVDHSAFVWGDQRWRGGTWASSVLYECHIGTFTPAGTFDAAIERLDHVATLGVTAIEILPVAEAIGSRGWGYDGVDLWAPHHAYGGPEGLKRFVDAAHRHGLAVILDVVYNHLGPAGNYLSEFGPYFTDRYSTPWGAAINVDGATRCGGSSSTTPACGCATTTSMGCGWMRCTPSSTRVRCPCSRSSPSPWMGCRPTWGAPCG